MEVEIDPTPVGEGLVEVPDVDIAGTGVKRDAEQSVEDLEAEIWTMHVVHLDL